MTPAAFDRDACPGICVIMAGGRGTRFWPLSRTARPKQLLALASGSSLLRDTFARLEPLVGASRILVVTSGELAGPIRAELPELPVEQVVAEPVGRNTAPCAVLGVGLAGRLDPAAPVALLPADHFIPEADEFRSQLRSAFAAAAARPTVITFGIPPTSPQTGYGYLRLSAPLAAGELAPGLEFVEKPDALTAEAYLRGGRHLWNSGIFVWNAAHFAAMAVAHVPRTARLLAPAIASFGTGTFAAALETAYRDCPADSIDFAVMEKLSGFEVLAARFGWSDLGSWDAWGELAGPLAGGNRGRGPLLALDSADNVLWAKDRLVALLGVRDLIVVDTPDALLVCHKDQAQRIKDVIAALEAEGRQELL